MQKPTRWLFGLMAVGMLLDRGLGKPVQSLELAVLDKKLNELSDAELLDLRARVVSIEASQPEQEQAGPVVH